MFSDLLYLVRIISGKYEQMRKNRHFNRGCSYMSVAHKSPASGPFVNFSNHPSAAWTGSQLNAALQYGPVVDIPFPPVDPAMKEADLQQLAAEKVKEILDLKPSAVMCQGEFGLSFSVTQKLLAAGITVLHACSERKVHSEGNVKTVRFDFVQFRKFEA